MVLWLFQEVGGSISVRCPKGKNCESKCGDNIYFDLADQGSSTCKYFKLPALGEEGRSRYKLDQYQWICNNNHVIWSIRVRHKTSAWCIRKVSLREPV